MKNSLLVLIAAMLTTQTFSQKIYTKANINVNVSTHLGNGTALPETGIVITLDSNNLKIVTRSLYSVSTNFIDRDAHKLTSLVEVMGKKMGFTAPSVAEKKPGDDSLSVLTIPDSTKNVNGFRCVKATITNTQTSPQFKAATVWYSTEYRFADSTMGLNIPGIDKIPGFPIQMDVVMSNGVLIGYSVQDIDLSPKLDKDFFAIPSGYEISSYEVFKQKLTRLTQGR